jgi:hypothetical protein
MTKDAKKRALAVALVITTTIASSASVAEARESQKAVCIASHEKAQVERREKKLRAAREHFVACARDACPTAVRKECSSLLAQVEASLPTVVFAVKDGEGHDTSNVRVSMDGAPILDSLTGAGVDVDPGEHVFRFVLPSGEANEQKGVVLEGDKNRKIEADFSAGKAHASAVGSETAPAPAPPPAEKKTIPPLTFVFGGVAVVALGSFVYFAATGKSAEKDLASSCSPNCSSSDVSPVHRDYLIADISLAVAAIGTVAAVWIAWPALTQQKTSSMRVGVRPLVGGAGLSAAGTF